MWHPRRIDDEDDRLDYDVDEDDGEDFTDDVYFDGPEDFEPAQDEGDGTDWQ